MRRLAIAAALLSIAVLAACGEDTPEAGQTSSPTPTPSATTFTEAEYRITVPTGWVREDATATVDAAKAVRYKDTDGDYFIVAIDPRGSDFASDEVWRYQIKGVSFEVVEKTKCTGGPDQQCSSTDNRYDIYLLWKSGTSPQKAGGHSWYFIFGNDMKPTIDQTAFEEIAESVRVTA